jgi:hypothetical protein
MTDRSEEKKLECGLCGATWWPLTTISVHDNNVTPNEHGIVLLVAHYKNAHICKSCVMELGRKLENERQDACEHWVHWDERDGNGDLRTFAYHRKKNFTWELLASGRPKKLSEVLLPPRSRFG